ncbi:MAG: pseudaminic acid synthase [Magnetococcales bacterium]|nr:pseudaminic acid synthase [Magnetococcales bacterium]
MNPPIMHIAGRAIGAGHPPYVIAELSGNHNGSLESAMQLLEAVKQAGADAVKLQTYTADTITIDCDAPEFRIQGGLWDGYTLYRLYQQAHTPWAWHAPLFARARALGLTLFSSPFDFTAVDFLEELRTPAYKIASFELVDLPLIRKVAATGKPMILSTGMANLEEIRAAVDAAKGGGCREMALLHCVSGYPTPPEECHLRTLGALADSFPEIVTGLSDHTLETTVPVAAVALGAGIIEKHVTLRRSDGGPDAAFSLQPEELRAVCQGCRTAWSALGRGGWERKPSEAGNVIFRRSLYVVADVAAGEMFTAANVRSIRPGHGLAPGCYPEILGKKASRPIARGTPLAWSLVAGE